MWAKLLKVPHHPNLSMLQRRRWIRHADFNMESILRLVIYRF